MEIGDEKFLFSILLFPFSTTIFSFLNSYFLT